MWPFKVTPLCSKCPVLEDTLSVMKPGMIGSFNKDIVKRFKVPNTLNYLDIVFFGESLPKVFHDHVEKDTKQVFKDDFIMLDVQMR